MISSFTVGAVFEIRDEAGSVLARMVQQLKEVDAAVRKTQERLEQFGAKFRGIAEQGSAMASGINESFGRINTTIEETTINIGNMAKAMRDAAASMRESAAAMNGGMARADAGIAGAAGGGGRHVRPGQSRMTGGSPHFSAPGANLGGGFHMRPGHSGGSMLAAGAAGILAYGMYEEAEVEDIAARAMLTGQIKTDAGMTQTESFKRIRDTIQRVSSKTGYSPKEVGEAILTTERQFGGLSFDKRLSLEETLIPYAASEARMKEATLPEAFEAMVGLAHMTGTYDEKKLPELMRQFQYASMITPVGINQFRGALSYSMPMLTAGLDMDPSSIMFLTAMTQTAGITNTKSGTWLRSFFENAEPKVGAHLSKGAKTHNEALEKMGLIDEHDHVTWQMKDATGKVDWDSSILKMSQLINKFTQQTDPATRLSTIRTAFGERGGGFAALMNLDQFIGQFPILQAKMKSAQGGDDVLTSLASASPVQAGRNTWADAQAVMMDIGSNTLPAVTSALHGFDSVLKGMKSTLGEGPTSAIVTGGLTAAALSWFSGPRALMGKGMQLGGTALSRIIGPVLEGIIGTGALGTVGGFLGGFGLLAATNPNRQDPMSQLGGGEAMWQRSRASQMNLRQGADMEAHRGAALGALPQPIINLKNDVKLSVSGHEIAVAIASEVLSVVMAGVTNALHLSNLNNQGGGQGTHDSPYASGIGAN